MRVMTSGAHSVLLGDEKRHVRAAAFQVQRQQFGKCSYLPAELICVLVVISMKINQQEAQLPLGIIQCLGIRTEQLKLQGVWARGMQHPQAPQEPDNKEKNPSLSTSTVSRFHPAKSIFNKTTG